MDLSSVHFFRFFLMFIRLFNIIFCLSYNLMVLTVDLLDVGTLM